MSADTKLAVAAASLSTAAPSQWRDFLEAFAEYTNQKRDECVTAPREAIYGAQGRAVQCNTLNALFINCRATAEKVKR